jgi:DnaJ-class molecular chaperone
MKTNNATLMTECRECGGAGLRTHDHPNDPWARVFECEGCEGTGEVVAECECCSRDAVTVFDGLKSCGSCAAEQRADAA